MDRWNNFSAPAKGLIIGVTVVILLVLTFFLSGVRCGLRGTYFNCGTPNLSPNVETVNTTTGNQNTEVKEPLSESPNRPEPIVSEGNAVVANDQPAGPIVEVTMLTLSQPGWVAVYEDNNGVPGNVLGAARFEEGIHLGEISLLRSTEPNKTYYLILHADVSEREFDLKKNAILMSADGSPVRTTFKTLE